MERRILCVGLVCVDIVTVAESYPAEDSETLADDCFWRRGGNASNTSSVLGHLGANVEFLGTIVRNNWQGFLLDSFKECGVKCDHCVFLDEAKHKAPVCTLVISRTTGTRTALPNFKNITEVNISDFEKLDLSQYSWVHFEGRAKSPDIEKMSDHVRKYNDTVQDRAARVRVSVEIEQKPSVCPELDILFTNADVVFVSKDYAIESGFNTKEEAVEMLFSKCRRDTVLICPWGEDGAAAKSSEGVVKSAAFPPDRLVDTIAAGDTFNAAVILALSVGKSLSDTVTFACRVAGAKCGMMGTSGVKGMQHQT